MSLFPSDFSQILSFFSCEGLELDCHARTLPRQIGAGGMKRDHRSIATMKERGISPSSLVLSFDWTDRRESRFSSGVSVTECGCLDVLSNGVGVTIDEAQEAREAHAHTKLGISTSQLNKGHITLKPHASAEPLVQPLTR